MFHVLTTALARLMALTTVAQTLGIALPISIGDAINKLMSILGTAQNFELPTSTDAILHDIQIALNDAAALVPGTGLATEIANVLIYLGRIPAVIHNIETGQVVTIAIEPISVNGVKHNLKIFMALDTAEALQSFEG